MGSKECTIYLIRHGETEGNAKKLVVGHKDYPLTKCGIRQARKLRKELQKVKFSKVYSSDLGRAVTTAKIVSGRFEISTSKLLRERKYGKFEGLSAAKFQKAMKKPFAIRESLGGKKRWQFKPAPDIESDAEVFNRVIKKVRRIVKENSGKKVLIATHGGCIRTILVGLSLAQHHQLPKDKLLFGNYLKIISDGKIFRMGKPPKAV
jgi:broad specificity phosphatase PhoE